VIGSGFGTAIVNYWLGQRKAKREFMRSKLEELHQAVRSYGDNHRAAFTKYSAALSGTLSFQIAIDRYEKVRGERSDAAMRSKIELLISFYLRALEPGMKKLITARSEIIKIFQHAEDTRAKSQVTSAYATPFSDALKAFEVQEGQLCKDIAKHAQKFV
jgi:hypothetical protein